VCGLTCTHASSGLDTNCAISRPSEYICVPNNICVIDLALSVARGSCFLRLISSLNTHGFVMGSAIIKAQNSTAAESHRCWTTGGKSLRFCSVLSNKRQPLWSSGESSWLQIGGPGSITGTTRKKNVVGLERGPLSLVSTSEELLDRKVAAPV
jgi:hypothetical protein